MVRPKYTQARSGHLALLKKMHSLLCVTILNSWSTTSIFESSTRSIGAVRSLREAN